MRSGRLYTPEAGPALRYVSSAHGDVAGARHQALNFSRPPPLMGAGLELRSPLADLAGERRSLRSSIPGGPSPLPGNFSQPSPLMGAGPVDFLSCGLTGRRRLSGEGRLEGRRPFRDWWARQDFEPATRPL